MDLNVIVEFVDGNKVLTEKLFNLIMPLLGTLLGGWLTYYFNIRSKKEEKNQELLMDRGKNILVPLCTNVEELLKDLEKSKETLNLIENKNIIERIEKCTGYLKANKRVFLDKKSKELLVEAEDFIIDFETELTRNKQLLFDIAKEDIEEVLNICSPLCFMNLSIDFKDNTDQILEQKLLGKNKIDMIVIYESITLILDDDEDNWRHLSFKFDENFLRNVYDPIKRGIDLNLDPEQERSLDLYMCLEKNISILNNKANKVIEENQIKSSYDSIKFSLEILQDHLNSKIDEDCKLE